MRITSTVAEYQKLADIEDQASRLQAWETGYETAHRDVFDVYYRSYSDPRHRDSAVADVPRISALVQGAASWPDDVGSHLIQEDIATAASRELHPGMSDSDYLWNDDQHGSWVRECRAAERALAAVVLDEMATPAQADHVWGLFAPDRQTGSLPSRSGYWLGDLLAQRWLSQLTLREVLSWDYAEATTRASSDLRARLK